MSRPGTKRRPITVIVPYYEGAVAPRKRGHPHRMREISSTVEPVGGVYLVLMGCDSCSKVEVLEH